MVSRHSGGSRGASLQDVLKGFREAAGEYVQCKLTSQGEFCCPRTSDASVQSTGSYQWVEFPDEEKPFFPVATQVKATLIGSTFTLTNTIIGSGTLAVPYAIASSGWLVGVLVMVIIAVLTAYSVRLLFEAADLAGEDVAKNYEGLGHKALGRYGTWMAEFTFIFGGFGTLVSYFILFSSLLSQVLGIDQSSRWEVMTVSVLLVVLPLSLVRSLIKLQFTSILAVVGVSYVVLMLVAFSALILSSAGHVSREFEAVAISPRSVYTVTLLVSAFCCHNTALPVYENLETKTLPRIMKAVASAISICFVLYSLIGISGYMLFGRATEDNILLSFDEDFMKQFPSTIGPIYLADLCMATSLLLSSPIALWPFRSCVLSVYLRVKNGQQMSSHMASDREYNTITVVSILLILACAAAAPNVRIPLSIVGSVAGSMIIMIMPSLFVVSLRRLPIMSGQNFGPLALLVGGIVFAIVSFSLTIYKVVEGHGIA